jgi:hypothetical protein
VESWERKQLAVTPNNVGLLQKPGGLDLAQVAPVIRDAVHLCKALGERYLWADALCIIQDDKSKHTQIQAMDAVYGRATWTLVAAVDPAKAQGLPGVTGNPRKSFILNRHRDLNVSRQSVLPSFIPEVQASAWNSRGWTFQERLLSLRRLYITNYQVYFECPDGTLQEESDGNSCCKRAHYDDNKARLPWIGRTGTERDYQCYQ